MYKCWQNRYSFPFVVTLFYFYFISLHDLWQKIQMQYETNTQTHKQQTIFTRAKAVGGTIYIY